MKLKPRRCQILVLTRKIGEVICLDGGVEIKVVHIDRNTVRLGITAPRTVNIIRKELMSDDPNNRKEQDDAKRDQTKSS
jgi:carbon storage regulator